MFFFFLSAVKIMRIPDNRNQPRVYMLRDTRGNMRGVPPVSRSKASYLRFDFPVSGGAKGKRDTKKEVSLNNRSHYTGRA